MAPNSISGKDEYVKVILDSTYLNPKNHKQLWDYLGKNATEEELSRVIELTVRLKE